MCVIVRIKVKWAIKTYKTKKHKEINKVTILKISNKKNLCLHSLGALMRRKSNVLKFYVLKTKINKKSFKINISAIPALWLPICSCQCCEFVNTSRFKDRIEWNVMNRQIKMNSNFFSSLSVSVKVICSLSLIGYGLSFFETAIQVS